MKSATLHHVKPYFLIFPLLVVIVAGCSGLRPARPIPASSQQSVFIAPPPVATPTAISQVLPTAEQPSDCSNNLTYLSDLSIPDGTHVNPGTVLDKQWQVKNSGTCNWNSQYSLRLTGGDALGAAETQALIPARAGSEAVLQITFTAPQQPGKYSSSWSAFGPDGEPFGDPVFIEIRVISP